MRAKKKAKPINLGSIRSMLAVAGVADLFAFAKNIAVAAIFPCFSTDSNLNVNKDTGKILQRVRGVTRYSPPEIISIYDAQCP